MFLCVFKEECVMSAVYNHKTVEKKWQQVWQDEKAFAATNDYSKPKYYALVEFPYPSGQGLHVGHPRPYTALELINFSALSATKRTLTRRILRTVQSFFTSVPSLVKVI